MSECDLLQPGITVAATQIKQVIGRKFMRRQGRSLIAINRCYEIKLRKVASMAGSHKLLDQERDAVRLRHDLIPTEVAYLK